eukprot:TRINITY_DN16837_c0_g3_i1.p1 TRINITY_DN16837_c0_g3~~TRINITY_DN16837_c0_g3_i1.p1  ORF type:complete len:440 (+),score=154.70 TRINITY_DN16837_c0_g3_i1:74-1321(+)
MAPKNVKRAAQASKAAPAMKVAKVAKPEAASKRDSLLDPVLEVIEQAEDLTDSCKKMLLAGAPSALSTPADERHAVLARVVVMVGEVVEGTRSKLQGSIDTETAKLGEVEATRAKLDSHVQQAEGVLSSAVEVVEAKQAALADAQKTTREKQAILDEAKATQQKEDAALEAARKEKEEYEVAFNDNFKILRDEELEFAKANDLQAALLKYAQGINVDSSLLTSLPTACTKPPATRGAFDSMVFQELEKELVEHLRKLTETITNAAPAAAERAEAVAAAQSAFEVAEKAQQLAAEELAAAEASRNERASELATAKEEVQKFAPEYEKATKTRDEKVVALAQFEKLNAACFVELRDRVAKKEAPAPEAEAAVDNVAVDEEEKVADEPAAGSGPVAGDVVMKEVPHVAPAVTVEVGGA